MTGSVARAPEAASGLSQEASAAEAAGEAWRVSVPGKLILIGEHAAVYGRPAVVAAVDPRLVVRASLRPLGRSGGGSVRLDLPDLGLQEEHSWADVNDFTRAARRRWRRFAAGECDFEPVRDGSALIRIAVGEAAASLPPAAAAQLHGRSLSLLVRSELPLGGGLGSSAAAAAGVVAAVWAAGAGPTAGPGSDGRPSRAELQAIESAVLEVERRQHGYPSGIDSGTVLRGGVLLVRRADGGLTFDDLPRPDWLSEAVRVFDSGRPGQTTGAVVTAVRRRREAAKGSTDALFDRIELAVEALCRALAGGRRQAAAAALSESHRALCELGVTPPGIARRIEEVEAAGGAAKVSGAGALSGDAAGAVICLPGPRPAEVLAALAGMKSLDARIGACGLRFEGAGPGRRWPDDG